MGASHVAGPDGPASAMAPASAAAASSAVPSSGSQAARFVCDICSQCFQRKNGLSRHMRSHTGEKPFACSYCHFKSTRTDSLQRHMKLHLHTAANSANTPTTLAAALSQAASSVASSVASSIAAATQAQAQAQAQSQAPAQAQDQAQTQQKQARESAVGSFTPSRPAVLLPQSPPQVPPQTHFAFTPPPPLHYPIPPPPPPPPPPPQPSAPEVEFGATAKDAHCHLPQTLPHSPSHSQHHQYAPSHPRHHPYFVPQPRRSGLRTPSPPACNANSTSGTAELVSKLANVSPAPSASDQIVQDAVLLQSIARPLTPNLPVIASQSGLVRTGDLAGFIPCVHDDDVDFSHLLDHALNDETNLGFATFVQSALEALAPALAAEARSDDATPEPRYAHALHTLASATEKEVPLGAAQIHAYVKNFSPSLPFIHSTFVTSTVDRPVGLGFTADVEECAAREHPFSGIGTPEDRDLLWAMALVGAKYTCPPPQGHGLMALKASLAQSLGHDAAALGLSPRSCKRDPLRQAQALLLVSLLSLFSQDEEGVNHARLFHAAAVSVARNLSLLPDVEGDDWSAWITRMERRRTLWAVWVCDLLQVILIPAHPWLTKVDPASLGSDAQWNASQARTWRQAMGDEPSSSVAGLSPALGMRRLTLAPPAPVWPVPGSLSASAHAGWEGRVSSLLALAAYITIECSHDWDMRATLFGDQDASDDFARDLTALDDRAGETIAHVDKALQMLPPLSRGLAAPRFRDLIITLLGQLETRLHTMQETDPLCLLARVSRGLPDLAEPRGIQSVLAFLGGGWTALFPPLC